MLDVPRSNAAHLPATAARLDSAGSRPGTQCPNREFTAQVSSSTNPGQHSSRIPDPQLTCNFQHSITAVR